MADRKDRLPLTLLVLPLLVGYQKRWARAAELARRYFTAADGATSSL